MDAFTASTFGTLNAADYDILNDPGTTDLTVNLFTELFSGGKSVLELAIGSGRIALPLAQRGFEMTGVEGSQDMIDLLRAKDGGAEMPVTCTDMAEFDLGQTFDHAFLVFNTLFNLTSQAAQLSCFQTSARHLNAGGLFVVETFVPDLSGFTGNQRVMTKKLDMDQVWLEAATHDPVKQLIEMQRIRITSDGMKLVPLPMRYAYPAEIDLMAQLAGLTLKHRWGGWDKSPFTPQSTFHISVYQK